MKRESNKKLYESALQQGERASLASIMRTSSARVVDQAKPRSRSVCADIRLNCILSMLGALMCGIVWWWWFRSDLRIQVPGVLGTHLNLRELGIIPSAKTDPAIRTVLRSIGSVDRNQIAGRCLPAPGEVLPTAWNW